MSENRITTELLPCPFCAVELEHVYSFSNRHAKHMAHPDNGCVLVGVIVILSDREDDQTRATAWNRRPPPKDEAGQGVSVTDALAEFEGYDKHGGVDDTITAARLLAKAVRAALSALPQGEGNSRDEVLEEVARLADDRADKCRDYGASIPNEALTQREFVAAAELRLFAMHIRALKSPPAQPQGGGK